MRKIQFLETTKGIKVYCLGDVAIGNYIFKKKTLIYLGIIKFYSDVGCIFELNVVPRISALGPNTLERVSLEMQRLNKKKGFRK